MLRSPGRHGIADLWHNADGTPTKLGYPESTPKRARGHGSRWRAWYIDVNGQPRTKRFSTKGPAEAWLAKETADLTRGEWIAPERSAEPFRVVAAEWLATKARRKAKTVAGYESILETLVLPRWGDTPLNAIRHGELQMWITELSETGSARKPGSGLSPSRVVQTHQLIGAVLKYAVRTERLVKNVADGIERPPKPSSQRRYLTHKQLQQLAVETGRFQALTLVMGYCGLRIGEAIALRRDDIEDATITVRASVTSVRKQGQVEGSTKTHQDRTVPVPQFVWDVLKPELPDDADADMLVFPSHKGGYLTIGEYRWQFDKAVAKLGLSGFVPHELRHTTASLAISAGANVKALQNLLGHASAVMTLDRYGHLLSDDLTKVAKALDKAARTAR
jgi:integrase